MAANSPALKQMVSVECTNPISVYPPDGEVTKGSLERNGPDNQCTGNISKNHHTLTVHPVCPGSQDQSKEQIGKEIRGSRNAQVERRAGQYVDQQRKGKERNGTTEVRDGLAGPVFSEVTVEPGRR